jgi:hypothetical protein
MTAPHPFTAVEVGPMTAPDTPSDRARSADHV